MSLSSIVTPPCIDYVTAMAGETPLVAHLTAHIAHSQHPHTLGLGREFGMHPVLALHPSMLIWRAPRHRTPPTFPVQSENHPASCRPAPRPWPWSRGSPAH